MSDTLKKYSELLEEGRVNTSTTAQRSVGEVVEIIRASLVAGNIETLLQKVTEVSKKAPKLSPAVVFQIAGDEAKVDELCTPNKQQEWNNQN